MEKVDVMVLGGGIAGLGAAKKAQDIGRAAKIFEAKSSAGGLLDNFSIDGFRFDNAVHLSFAQEPAVRAIFDQTPFWTHPADSKCFDKHIWLKHPVQNNLFPLPPQEKVELIESFLARPDAQADDYESWLRHQYGDKIAERYPLGYTKKYWGTEARDLSTTWIGNRMRRAEIGEILYGAFTADTPNTYYTKEMRYPKQGGFKQFIQPLLDSADIQLNFNATRIDLAEKTVCFNNETVISYAKLVSTLPLPHFVELCVNAPEQVLDAADKLDATSVDLISIGFNKPLVNDLWFYIYDENILASRAYSPSVKSPDSMPAGCSSLQFEIYQRGRAERLDPDVLKENTLFAIEKMGIAKREDIVVIHHKHLPYGNVIFDKGMEANRAIVRNFIQSAGVASCGRFGEWDYLWSNQSFLSGYNSF